MKARARHDHRQDAVRRDGIGPRPERHRVCHRSADEVAHHLHRHVIQHDRDDDLTGVETLAQIADEDAKRGAADEAEDQKGNESDDAPTGEIGCEENRHDRPSDQLAVAADIEQAGAKRKGDAEPDQSQRDGVDEHLARALRAERIKHEVVSTRHGLWPATSTNRLGTSAAKPRTMLRRTSRRDHGAVIQWPISAELVSPTGTGPRNLPRAMTITRSARSQISDRSAESSRMATPLARCATRRLRMAPRCECRAPASDDRRE